MSPPPSYALVLRARGGRQAARRSRPTRAGRPGGETLEGRTSLTGTWATRTKNAPAVVGTMLLLSDGTVLAQQGGTAKQWYKLTPDSSGDYVNGTWSNLASMSLERQYFATNVLPDGRVFLVGGEYSGPMGTKNW